MEKHDDELYFHLTWWRDYGFKVNHEFFKTCYCDITIFIQKYYNMEIEYINFNPEVYLCSVPDTLILSVSYKGGKFVFAGKLL